MNLSAYLALIRENIFPKVQTKHSGEIMQSEFTLAKHKTTVSSLSPAIIS